MKLSEQVMQHVELINTKSKYTVEVERVGTRMDVTVLESNGDVYYSKENMKKELALYFLQGFWYGVEHEV